MSIQRQMPTQFAPDERRHRIVALIGAGVWRYVRFSAADGECGVRPPTAENLPNSFDTGLEVHANGWLSGSPRVNAAEIPEVEAT